jgi:hypothetical protein
MQHKSGQEIKIFLDHVFVDAIRFVFAAFSIVIKLIQIVCSDQIFRDQILDKSHLCVYGSLGTRYAAIVFNALAQNAEKPLFQVTLLLRVVN